MSAAMTDVNPTAASGDVANLSQPGKKTRRVPDVVRLPYSNKALRRDIGRLRALFKSYRRNRDRDAIYVFLSAVYNLIDWWTRDGRAEVRARRLIILRDALMPRNVEPFAAVIMAIAHPTKIDRRTLSKWSRVLRYAIEYKSPGRSLRRFVIANGGLNECAALYTGVWGDMGKNDKFYSLVEF
jgi:hypothetical protein